MWSKTFIYSCNVLLESDSVSYYYYEENANSIGVGTGGAGGAIAPPLFPRQVAGFAKACIVSITDQDALIFMLPTHNTCNLTTILLAFTFVSDSARPISSSA